jgi:hypothetical protein
MKIAKYEDAYHPVDVRKPRDFDGIQRPVEESDAS